MTAIGCSWSSLIFPCGIGTKVFLTVYAKSAASRCIGLRYGCPAYRWAIGKEYGEPEAKNVGP